MRSKWINKIFEGVVALIFLFGFTSIPAISQVVPVGKTEEQASQLIFWYDQTPQGFGRTTLIQVTNASPNPVNVHVQILTNSPGAICDEVDFDDFYTGNDTHIYNLTDIVPNDGTSPVPNDVNETKGFIVITPINNIAEEEAISFQHLFGNSYIFDVVGGVEYRLNSMGRDAVSFTTGDIITEDYIELDGIANGFVVIQPEILKFNFNSLPGSNFADIVSIAFVDNYNAPFGGYAAQAGAASWNARIFDEFEEDISGCDVTQNCFFDIGLNEVILAANPYLGDILLCPGNTTPNGWVKIEVGGLGDLENELGIVAITTPPFGGASWMY